MHDILLNGHSVTMKDVADYVRLTYGDLAIAAQIKKFSEIVARGQCSLCHQSVKPYNREAALTYSGEVYEYVLNNVKNDAFSPLTKKAVAIFFSHKDKDDNTHCMNKVSVQSRSKKIRKKKYEELTYLEPQKLTKQETDFVYRHNSEILSQRVTKSRNNEIFSELIGQQPIDISSDPRFKDRFDYLSKTKTELARFPWLMPYYMALGLGGFDYPNADGFVRKIFICEKYQTLSYTDVLGRKHEISAPAKIARINGAQLTQKFEWIEGGAFTESAQKTTAELALGSDAFFVSFDASRALYSKRMAGKRLDYNQSAPVAKPEPTPPTVLTYPISSTPHQANTNAKSAAKYVQTSLFPSFAPK